MDASASLFLNSSFPPVKAIDSSCLSSIKRRGVSMIWALEKKNNKAKNSEKMTANLISNYVVSLDKSSCITRPLVEILRDLNKRVPSNIVRPQSNDISWFHANRMLSFYAPGWNGEIRKVVFSDNGTVTVVYRVTIRGSDGEVHRESTGSVSLNDCQDGDPVAAAEELAFVRACARFGLGLHLYHEDETV